MPAHLAARYHKTPVAEVLPVTMLPYDDRVAVPEGFRPEIVDGQGEHPILRGLGSDWPVLLGYNEVLLKQGDGIQLLARTPADAGGHPLLVTGTYGEGRTLVWTSDVGPHWLPEEFARGEGYARLWIQALDRLTGRSQFRVVSSTIKEPLWGAHSLPGPGWLVSVAQRIMD